VRWTIASKQDSSDSELSFGVLIMMERAGYVPIPPYEARNSERARMKADER
jgi:hypothetical protein